MEQNDKKISLICSACNTKYAIDLSNATEEQLKRSHVKCKKCGQPIALSQAQPAESNQETQQTASPPEPNISETKLPEPIQNVEKTEQSYNWPRSSLLAEDSEQEQDNWLALYGDMMSILLIFFVLMFAISSIDKQKFQSIIEGVSKALGGTIQYEAVPTPSEDDKMIPPRVLQEEPIDLERVQEMVKKLQSKVTDENESLSELETVLKQLINQSQLDQDLSLKDEPKGLVLIAQDVSMFKSGSADIMPKIKPILLEVGKILSELNIEIIVEGHTDDIPISTQQFASNWELSTKRATNVVHYFIENCAMNPTLVSAAGYAENRPRHDFDGPEASKNRRIEIVVKKKYDTEVVHDIMNIDSETSIPQFIE